MKRHFLPLIMTMILVTSAVVFAENTQDLTASGQGSEDSGSVSVQLTLEEDFTMTIPTGKGEAGIEITGTERQEIGRLALSGIRMLNGSRLDVTVSSLHSFQLVDESVSDRLSYDLIFWSRGTEVSFGPEDEGEEHLVLTYEVAPGTTGDVSRTVYVTPEQPIYPGTYQDTLTFTAQIIHPEPVPGPSD